MTGILVQGSNGEAQHLSHEEKIKCLKVTRETLDKNGFQNVVIIAGTGAQSTRETILLCEEAKEAGASHVLVLTPSTWPGAMSRENILRFFRTVRPRPRSTIASISGLSSTTTHRSQINRPSQRWCTTSPS